MVSGSFYKLQNQKTIDFIYANASSYKWAETLEKLLNIATKGKLYYLILISLYSITNSIVTVTKYKLFLKNLK